MTYGREYEKMEAGAAELRTHKVSTRGCIRSMSIPLVSESHCNLRASRGLGEERQQGIECDSTSGGKRREAHAFRPFGDLAGPPDQPLFSLDNTGEP